MQSWRRITYHICCDNASFSDRPRRVGYETGKDKGQRTEDEGQARTGQETWDWGGGMRQEGMKACGYT